MQDEKTTQAIEDAVKEVTGKTIEEKKAELAAEIEAEEKKKDQEYAIAFDKLNKEHNRGIGSRFSFSDGGQIKVDYYVVRTSK